MESGSVVLRLTLGEMNSLGECEARAAAETFCVSGGIPGEEVLVQVIARRKGVAFAQVVEVLKPSPHRTAPPCPYFGPCSGCQWQHISYQHQLELKHSLVKRALDRVPQLGDVAIGPVLPSPQTLGYRNHARFTVRRGQAGFVHRRTRRFLPIDRCLIMADGINSILSQLQGRCAETTQLSVRYGVNTGEHLIQPRLDQVPLATGQPSYHEALLGRRLRVSSPSFFQVNTAQADSMVSLLRQGLGLSGRQWLVDAYSGVGTLTILLAPYCRRVTAIEESSAAVKDARGNAEGIENLDFCLGKVEDILGTMEGTPDVLVLDPPRAGCHPRALQAVCRLMPTRAVYVSCDPDTLARDLGFLSSAFQVEAVQPLDMFPQTHHVECLAFLRRRSEHKPIILASASPRRREIMSQMGIPFNVVPSEGDEIAQHGASPEEMAQQIALAKARQVAESLHEGVVLAADTVVVLEGEVMGKPQSEEEAFRILMRLRGRTHRVITGVAGVDVSSGAWHIAFNESTVTMRSYREDEVRAYVGSGLAMDKAGAYGVQDVSFSPVEEVRGCYLNVVGLAPCLAVEVLEKVGARVVVRPGWLPPKECQQCPLGWR
ncbi:MAG: septum formation protein Maf, partial [Chloroflexi bacterium]|nr:septum formation protein Maf [Chloroflexota bacterium]